MQKTITYLSTAIVAICLLASCQQPGVNSAGSEYMPDMAHSVAYEANYYSYYYYNTWGSEDEYYKFASPRQPVAGTIPRGIADATQIGSLTYDYEDTEEERTRAMNEIVKNPLPITDEGLAQGKELYDVMCGICHGDKGDGLGYLVREDGGKYPAAPANFLLEEHLNASNGRYYHAIMYGKNVMGSYKDKLSYNERWNVIHYIRSLQAKELKKEYNQLSNTLNDIDVPAGEIAIALGEAYEAEEEMKHDHNEAHDSHHGEEGHDEGDYSHDEDHGHDH